VNKALKISGILFMLIQSVMLNAQQSHSLFLMHYLPESNLMNPAVPISCKWYIGLPVLSSVHVNYGNSGFSYKNIFKPVGDGSYQADVDNVVNGLRPRNYLGTEIHTQLLAIGHRRGEYSLMFTITEKDNLPTTYPKKLIQLAWDGNTQFEGEEVGFKGTGIYYNDYREYALSVSKYQRDGIYYGVRAKLLFGKLNIATRSTDVSLYTNENTFNLDFSGDVKVHSSLPMLVETTDGRVSGVSYNEGASITGLIFNRKNPGFAVDVGIIYPYSDKLELSAALLDLGFIRWRSNLNTFIGSGEFTYEGPLNDSLNTTDGYFNNVLSAFSDSMNLVAEQQKYTTMLSPRIIAAGNYRVSEKLKTGVQGELLFYKTKVLPSLTLSANYNLFRYTYLVASYTVQYNTFRNFGLGFVLGRNPLQFYMISDNVAGFIWPLSTRNINLRFGLNINLGCNIKTNDSPKHGALQGNCYYLEKNIRKNYSKEQKSKKK
jgi:hypothetical protein